MADFGKLNFSVSFNPTSAFPLDSRYYFDSLAAAEAAAAGAVEVGLATGTYFIGEELVVVENNKATLYIIQPDKTLSPVGTAPVGDDKTITVSDEGVISIKGKIVEDAVAIEQYQLMSDNSGNVTWSKVDAASVPALQGAVEVLQDQMSAAQEDITTIEGVVGNSETGLVKEVADIKQDLTDNYYDKTVVDGLVAGAFHFKGTADSIDEDGDLVKDGNKITDQKQGDVYQVGEKEYAWNGETWTELGFTIDLSNYATTASVTTAKTEAIAAAAQDATDKADAAEEAAKGYTDEQITALGIADYAKTTEVTSAISTAKTELQNYTDQAEADAIAAAGTNADTKIATKVGDIGDVTVKSYVDSKETSLKTEIKAVDDKVTNLGTLANKNEVTETELAGALKDKIDNKADKATTLAGYGITDAMTATAITDLVSPISEKANINTNKLTGLTEDTVIAEINKAKEAAITSASNNVNSVIEDLDLENTYEAKGAAKTVQDDLDSYKTSNNTAVATAQTAAEAAQASANSKVASVSNTDKSINVGGTATAPIVSVNISADENNALELTDNGLKVVIPEAVAAPEYTIVKDENSGDYAATYHLTKDGINVGAAINIPKDLVVKEGRVEGDKLILVLNNEENTEIEIPVGSLIEYVTSGSEATDMVVISIGDDHKVTATITDGTINQAKLDTEVQQAIERGKKAVTDVALNGTNLEKDTNGKVNVPLAFLNQLGVVASSEGENKISVSAEDGTMEVNNLNINKLIQTDGDWLVLNGGKAIID